MNRIHFLLAWRYMYGAPQEKSIAIMIKICFWAIAIGSFSLALILSIMNGFEKMTHAKLQGIHAHIIIKSSGDQLQVPAIASELLHHFPEVVAWSPSTVRQGIIQGSDTEDISNVVMIKGIDPHQEALTSILQDTLTPLAANKRCTLFECLHNKSVIIGTHLAKQLGVTIGNPITLLYTSDEQTQGKKVTFNEQQALVSATFTTGIDEFDSSLVICSLDFLHTLWPDAGIEQLNIKVAPTACTDTLLQRLRDHLKLDMYSWKELYPALVAALKLEKYAMFFILALICLVASMNSISLAFMQITHKRGDIAILKTMGFSDGMICRVFLMVNCATAVAGAFVGLLLAVGVGWFLQTYPFITLPDSYYVSHLPIAMEWHLFAFVFIFVITLSSIAAWIPVQRTRNIRIADVLRHEA